MTSSKTAETAPAAKDSTSAAASTTDEAVEGGAPVTDEGGAAKTTTKTAAKKTATAAPAAKKSAAKKSPAKAPATKKSTVKKVTTKKPAAKKATKASTATKAARLVVREDESPWTAAELKEVRADLNAEIELWTRAGKVKIKIGRDLDVRRIETLKDGTEPVGNRTRVKVVKNKMAPPFKQAEFDILYGVGISREGGLIDMGVEEGIVKKSGAWFTYDGDQLGQGKENARRFLKDNPDLANEIEERILTKLGIGVAPEAEDDEAPALTAVPGDTAAG